MKRLISCMLCVVLLLSLGLAYTAAAQETLELVSPRKAVAIEETLDLTAMVKSGTVKEWQSSDPAVLAVNGDKAVGMKLGNVALTAIDADGETAICQVTVGYYTGIDVSYAQTVDWDVLSAQGIDFAMFRSSYGWDDRIPNEDGTYNDPYDFQMDAKFPQNVSGAKQIEIPFGLYHYSYATTIEEAHKEADYLLGLLEQVGVTPMDLKLPIAYDVEDGSILGKLEDMGKEEASKVVLTFCQDLQAAGFRTALYTSKNHFTHYFDMNTLYEAGIRLWMAWYPNEEDFDLTKVPALDGFTPFMWQYSETGRVTGVTRLSQDPEDQDTVDMNALYMSEMMLHRPNDNTNPDPSIILGDVDVNGLVTASDALLALQHSTEKVTLQPEQITAADVDKDGSVTASDALTILQYSTKKITQL